MRQTIIATAPATSTRLTPHFAQIVKQSFAHIAPDAARFGATFYENLFAAHPEYKPLFRAPMDEQVGKFTAMLGVLVNSLEETEHLARRLKVMGERHANYGVVAGDYDKVGAVLLDTLSDFVAEEECDAVCAAWLCLFEFCAGAMQAAAAESRLQAAR